MVTIHYSKLLEVIEKLPLKREVAESTRGYCNRLDKLMTVSQVKVKLSRFPKDDMFELVNGPLTIEELRRLFPPREGYDGADQDIFSGGREVLGV